MTEQSQKDQNPAGQVRPLWRERDYALYWVASIISYAGSRLTYVALPVLVFALTGSPLLTSLILAMEAVSYLLVGLVAGALADRHERKRVLVLADVANAVLLGSIPLASYLDRLTIGHLFVVAGLSGIATVFFDSADLAALPMLVSKDRLPAAMSALFGPATVIGLVAPGIAGALMAVMDTADILAIDALSFAASAAFLRLIARRLTGERPTKARPTSLLTEIKEGLVYLWSHPTIRPMTLMSFAQSAFGGVAIGQFVPLAADLEGASRADWAASLIFLVWGVGGFGAAVLYPWLARRMTSAWIALVATPLSALGGIACAITGNLWALLIVLLPWSVVFSVNASNNVVYRQSVTPEELLSRVNASGRMLAWGVGTTVGALTGGLVSNAAGPAAAFLVGALFGVLAAVLAWTSALRLEPRRPVPSTS